MVIEALFIGLVVGFLYYELVGLSPGGVVAPGYLALFTDEPSRILVTILLAFIVWGIMELLSPRLVLYGRRRLLLALLLGFSLKLAVEAWIQPVAGGTVDVQSIGYVIPGLIANEMSRQKPLPTLSSLILVSVVVAMILLLW